MIASAITSNRVRRQQGAVATMVAIMLLPMFLLMGLGVDAGRLFAVRSGLQSAADACALAAAASMTGGFTAAQQAELATAAGTAVGAENRLGFIAGNVTPTIAVDFPNLDGQAGTPRYARCTASRANIALVFPVLNNLQAMSVSTQAVASVLPSSAACASPIAVCDKAGGYAAGSVLRGRLRNSDETSTQRVQWIDYESPGGGFSNGAAYIEGLLAGNGACVASNVRVRGDATNLASTNVESAYNSRFGLYKGAYTAATNPPDYTGYSYDRTDLTNSQMADFRNRRSSFSTFTGSPYGATPATFTPLASTAQYRANASDRRMIVAPVVNCPSGAALAGPVTVLRWACLMMRNPVNGAANAFTLEYVGAASSARSGCVAMGVPDATATGPSVPALVQ